MKPKPKPKTASPNSPLSNTVPRSRGAMLVEHARQALHGNGNTEPLKHPAPEAKFMRPNVQVPTTAASVKRKVDSDDSPPKKKKKKKGPAANMTG